MVILARLEQFRFHADGLEERSGVLKDAALLGGSALSDAAIRVALRSGFSP